MKTFMTRIPFPLIVALFLLLTPPALPASEEKALIHKTRTEQTLTLPALATDIALVKIDITPLDSTLLEQEQRSLPEGTTLWIGVWSEGNRGRHLRAWVFSPKNRTWSQKPLADVMSDVKVEYTISGTVLTVQTYTLQDDQSLEPDAKPLRFGISAARP